MQFYFIRHGESVNNRLWYETRSNKGRSVDPELTDLGHQQAKRLAQFISRPAQGKLSVDYDLQNVNGFGLTHLYTSLMIRAVQTGLYVSQALDLPLHAWEDLHEEGGIYEDDEETGKPKGLPGGNRAFYVENYPKLVLPDALGEAGWWNRPFEAHDTRPERARRFLSDLLARHGGTDDHVAIFSHGGFYNLFIAAWLGLPRLNGTWYTMNNCAITRFNFDHTESSLIYSNRVDFLPPEMLT